jgi:hypothetical protein
VFTYKAPATAKDQLVTCTGPVTANTCGVPEGDRSGLSDGYWLMLKPLSPGLHTLYIHGAVSPGSYAAVDAAVAWDIVVGP